MSTHFLATPLGTNRSNPKLTDMVELTDASKVTQDNIIRPAFEDLPTEEQESFNQKIKQITDVMMQRLLGNFTIDRHKKVTKEEINLQDLLSATSSSTAPPTNPNVSNLTTAEIVNGLKG